MTDNPYSGRRQQLIDELEEFRKAGWDKHNLGQESRRRYESALKSFTELDGIQTQKELLVSQSKLIEAQNESAAAQRAETNRLENERRETESQSFWSRRFITNLTVAHAAGAFASVTALLRTPAPEASFNQASWILGSFMTGLAIMGALPLASTAPASILCKTKAFPRITTFIATFISTALLILGVWLTITVALQTFEKANLQAVSAETKPIKYTAEINLSVSYPETSPPQSPASR